MLPKLGVSTSRFLERIRTALPQALRTPHLPAVERAAIGRYLAVIGDPRTEITTVELMPVLPIPAGKFWMGKGQYDERCTRRGEQKPRRVNTT